MKLSPSPIYFFSESSRAGVQFAVVQIVVVPVSIRTLCVLLVCACLCYMVFAIKKSVLF